VFLAEAAELLPSIATNLRGLASNPNDRELARDLMRKLHTVKGSARMAGAMRLGELVHEMETRMEAAMQLADVPAVIVDDLHTEYDQAMALYDELQNPDAARAAESAAEPPRAPVIDLAAARADTKVEARAEPRPTEGRPQSGRRRRWARRLRQPRPGSRRPRPSSACARTSSTSWSTRPARSRSRARSSRTRSARSRAR
jgi:chemosensory pili system protein ChpA (sensor histidine kinase/response regulator)